MNNTFEVIHLLKDSQFPHSAFLKVFQYYPGPRNELEAVLGLLNKAGGLPYYKKYIEDNHEKFTQPVLFRTDYIELFKFNWKEKNLSAGVVPTIS